MEKQKHTDETRGGHNKENVMLNVYGNLHKLLQIKLLQIKVLFNLKIKIK